MVLIQCALGYCRNCIIYHSSIHVFTISYQCGRPSLRDGLSYHSRNTNACDKQNNENKMPVLGSLYLFAYVDVKCSHLDAQVCTMCHTMKLFSSCCYRPAIKYSLFVIWHSGPCASLNHPSSADEAWNTFYTFDDVVHCLRLQYNATKCSVTILLGAGLWKIW